MLLGIFEEWSSVLDQAVSSVVDYSRKLSSYRNESYLDLDDLSIGE